MIIKSLSRKDTSFKELLNYFHKQGKNIALKHNLLSTNKEEAIKEFKDNSSFLPTRKKGNYLYHEIISLEENTLSKKEQFNILQDLGEKYLKIRAPKQLAYGVIHSNTKNTHLHLCISSNNLYSNKRVRVSKKEFASIQKEIEEYKEKNFSKLEEKSLYKQNSKNRKISNSEYELKKRTKKNSFKEELILSLTTIFKKATSIEQLNSYLKKEKITLIKRGNNISVKIETHKRNYRLKTLGLDELYKNRLTHFQEIIKRKAQLNHEREEHQKVKNQDMNIQQAKKISLKELLHSLGFKPVKIINNEAWYKSPFREERTPSFKIHLEKNIWFDFGEGVGGNIIDFAKYFYGVNSITQALEKLDTLPKLNNYSTPLPLKENQSLLKLQSRQALNNTALLRYCLSRGISKEVAKANLEELYYTYKNRAYFALGFKNDSGGYELRNPYFKGCLGKKNITTNLKDTKSEIHVFEGFMDYLSALSLQKKEHLNSIILNSTSLALKVIPLLQDATKIYLYRDNDAGGKKLLEFFRNKLGDRVVDCALSYQKHNDLNSFLQSKMGFLEEKNKEMFEREKDYN